MILDRQLLPSFNITSNSTNCTPHILRYGIKVEDHSYLATSCIACVSATLSVVECWLGDSSSNSISLQESSVGWMPEQVASCWSILKQRRMRVSLQYPQRASDVALTSLSVCASKEWIWGWKSACLEKYSDMRKNQMQSVHWTAVSADCQTLLNVINGSQIIVPLQARLWARLLLPYLPAKRSDNMFAMLYTSWRANSLSLQIISGVQAYLRTHLQILMNLSYWVLLCFGCPYVQLLVILVGIVAELGIAISPCW